MLVDVRIQLRYFGVLKDLLGCDEETLELPEEARVKDAIRLLRGRASKSHDAVWTTMAVAVNLEYVPVSAVLKDADEVALLPPVSGGGPEIER